MKQRAVAIVADYLSHRPLGRIVGLKAIADDDYVVVIEDIRDGRVHLARSPKDLEPWLKSFKSGECIQPAFRLCGRCTTTLSRLPARRLRCTSAPARLRPETTRM